MNLEMAGEMTDKQLAIYDVAFIEGAYTAASLLQVDLAPAEIDQQLKKLSLQ